MSYESKSTFQTNNTSAFTAGSNKWTGVEVQDRFRVISDSVAWESQKYTMSNNTYDCSNGNLQERTLPSNGTLIITNAEAGKYYTLIKKGAYTLTLPTSEFSASGSVTGTSTTIVTFFYDGTDYYFSFAAYSGT